MTDPTPDLSDILGPIVPLNARGAYATRELHDGRIVDVVPLTFGRARLIISTHREAVTWVDGW